MTQAHRSILITAMLLCCLGTWRTIRAVQADVTRFDAALPPGSGQTSYSEALVWAEQLERALNMNRRSPDALLNYAAYKRILKQPTEALEIVREAQRYRNGMSELRLEAKLLEDLHKMEESAEAFQRMHRMAPVDRMVIQQLYWLYQGAANYEPLRPVSLEADIRWPGVFDTIMALGQGQAVGSGDEVFLLKHYYLSLGDPAMERNHPEPRAFTREQLRATVDEYLKKLEGPEGIR